MKKLFITAVFALGSLTAFAQEEQATEAQDAATEVQDQATDAATEVQDEATEGAAEGQEAATEAVAQDDFSEIAVEEVPEAITTMIETNYPGATVNGAAKNEAGHYKVEVSLEDGTSGALIVDEEGNAVEQ
ncbi:hypothetical protein SAMN05421636_101115 [Pricia antarctica]|uniref:Beta-lactamase-inhibitor-like, PepSY-like n=1 Tax=Pricia antarctica TaxID=641691 RepID=A0A1G6VYB2_9FLAO|nr:hypothetical protein [Pricia antarctica]SDD58622.1 hypothetical protein SAMN05421636_101115 [Pricia antarctica]